jgi:hypothetical protein
VLALPLAACRSGAISDGSPAPSASPTARATASPTPVLWSTLKRRLNLPVVAPGNACPRSHGQTVSAAFGPGLDGGPVYPVGLGTAGTLGVVASDGSYIQKVLWVGAASYSGPVLIRGGRLDRPGWVKFALSGSRPVDELRLQEPTAASPGEEPGWREWPSSTYVPAAGCYAYQVDGIDFSRVIVFEARIGAD